MLPSIGVTICNIINSASMFYIPRRLEASAPKASAPKASAPLVQANFVFRRICNSPTVGIRISYPKSFLYILYLSVLAERRFETFLTNQVFKNIIHPEYQTLTLNTVFDFYSTPLEVCPRRYNFAS